MLHRLCQAVDCTSIATAWGAFVGVLPTIAVVLPIIWWGIKLYKEWRDWDKNEPPSV